MAARSFRFVILLVALAGLMAAGPDVPGVMIQGDAPLEVGAEAPDFELESLDGETLRLGSLEGERSAVVVFFRGAW